LWQPRFHASIKTINKVDAEILPVVYNEGHMDLVVKNAIKKVFKRITRE